MNWDIIEGKWKQVSGAVKMKWGKLTAFERDFQDSKDLNYQSK